MKVAGWILIVFGALSLIGAAAAGNSAFGPLFWIGLGIAFVCVGKRNKRTVKVIKEKKSLE